MRNIEIIGYGTDLPKKYVEFDGQKRYRATGNENQLTFAVNAANRALNKAKLSINDIDLIVSAAAVGIQPIPCTAALIHEQIAKGTDIPAMDINTTCTSFVSALDTVSYFIEAGKYNRILIVSSEIASEGLNPNQKESYELFGDGAAAVIVQRSSGESGIIGSMQKTWSEGAHSTEIRGGLSNFIPSNYDGTNDAEFMFDMKGRQILSIAAKKVPAMFKEFFDVYGLNIDDIDLVVPHQASKALGMIMNKVGFPKNKYVDIVSEYGNMVSASIPFALCKSIENGLIKKGDTVMLAGTAAGLTTNILVFKY